MKSPFSTTTFYELNGLMEKWYEQGKLNGMRDDRAWQYAMQQMTGEIDRFNMKWLDNKVTESYNKEVVK